MTSADLSDYYRDLVGLDIKGVNVNLVRDHYDIVKNSISIADIRGYLKYLDIIDNKYPRTDEFLETAVYRLGTKKIYLLDLDQSGVT